MNRHLINWFDGINNILALLIIGAGALVTFFATAHDIGIGPALFVGGLGGIGGMIIAAIVCGFFATVVEIERHLRQIAAATQKETPEA